MIKTYTIIAGVNGTGKSSLTGVLWKQRSDLGQIIDADKLASDNGGNNILAGRLAIQQIRDCLAKGLCFTQETTLSGSLTAHTAQKALDAGYKICIGIMWGWILRKNLLHELQIGYGKAGTTFRRQMYVVVLKVE